jgi:mannose-6-phosphate isomerase-like protein (cupin superfamily)
MTLAPSEPKGWSDNRRRGADQWLHIVSGAGEAVVNGEGHPLWEGTLLLIEAGNLHEIRKTGEEPMSTLNVYDPPAYTADGAELPAGEK